MTFDPAGYLVNGPFAEPGSLRPRLAAIVGEIGPDPRALAARVRDLMVHVFWRKAYGLPEDRDRSEEEVNIRDLRGMLARIAQAQATLGRAPESIEPLPPEGRLIGNCRDFSLFFAAALREAGIPARARCGFGMYFEQGRGIDHWVVERWDETARRWVISDAQLDELMLDRLKIAFDPMDMPDGVFRCGGEAWLACRAGDDPERYGIFDMHGWDFIKGDFVRDVASLAGMELLPWDIWGGMGLAFAELTGADLDALDHAAKLTPMRATLSRAEAESLCADARFAVPREIGTWREGRLEMIDLESIAGAEWPFPRGTV